MKDYSKVKYVKPSVDGEDITRGKVYTFKYVDGSMGIVYDDRDYGLWAYIPECLHLENKHWIPCDENGKEIEL